jgi:hypothetical protein
MTQPQADREVTRKLNLFYSGLVEDMPNRETGDGSQNGVSGLIRAVNVIPTQKTLKCRPSTFDIANGTLPDMVEGEQLIHLDVNSYGEAIAITSLGRVLFHFIPPSPYTVASWVEGSLGISGAGPVTLTALDVSVHSINHRWYVDTKTETFANRTQWDLSFTVVPIVTRQVVGFAQSDYDLYMRQAPGLGSTVANMGPSQPTPYIYDFIYTFVSLDVDGNIVKETGSFDQTGFPWNPGGESAPWFRFYSDIPISSTSGHYIDRVNVQHTPGAITVSPLVAPAGYTHIAIYRTVNKSSQTPSASANTLATQLGGLLNLDFRLCAVASTGTLGNVAISLADTALTSARVLPTLQYVPIPFTNVSVFTNGIYMAQSGNILYYSDVGATPASLGFCYPGIQQIDLESPCTSLNPLQNSIVATSASTTWVFSLSNIVYLQTKVPGRVLGQLQNFSTLHTVGINAEARLAATTWTNSALIAFCSDRSIRVFNGVAWGDDLAFNKVSRRLTKATQAMLHYDSRGYILLHYLDGTTALWNTLRMSLRQDTSGTFSEFGGTADWPVYSLCKTPSLVAGTPFMKDNVLVPGGAGILMWNSVAKKIQGYSEFEAYYSVATPSACVIGCGTFTGENMSYWTTHTESHLYLDNSYSVSMTPGGATVKIEGLYAGIDSIKYDNNSTVAGDFLDGEDISFAKNIGSYRGYNLEFSLAHGGYEIIGIDTKFRVIDRPVMAKINLALTNEANWSKALISRWFSRYNPMTDICKPSNAYTGAIADNVPDVLAQPGEPDWAITPLLGLQVTHATASSVWCSYWFKLVGSAEAVTLYGQSMNLEPQLGPTRTTVSIGTATPVNVADVYISDGQWHFVAIGPGRFILDGVAYSHTPDLSVLVPSSTMYGNSNVWDLCVLDASIVTEANIIDYFQNLRNYCRA